MNKFSAIKYILISLLSLFLFGCSAIMTSIGNSKIENSIKIYNTRGITEEGSLDLISGLSYSPNSVIGIVQYQKQYDEITNLKNRILNNKKLSSEEINLLNIYLLTIQEFQKINSKILSIKIDYNDFNKSKNKINKMFEEFVLRDEKNYINRNQKIQKINYYKKMNKYINSYIIRNVILNLENDVTVNLYIGSSFRSFSKLDYLVRNSLIKASDINANRNLGNYVVFRGFSSFINSNQKNIFIDLNFSNVYIRTLETKKEVKEKDKIFIAYKKITVSGHYKVYSGNYNSLDDYFEFDETYSVRIKKNDETTIYDDEYEIIQNILEDKFSDIIRFDLDSKVSTKF